jgi:hypothetical protein
METFIMLPWGAYSMALACAEQGGLFTGINFRAKYPSWIHYALRDTEWA